MKAVISFPQSIAPTSGPTFDYCKWGFSTYYRVNGKKPGQIRNKSNKGYWYTSYEIINHESSV